MHIPKEESSKINILTFEEAMNSNEASQQYDHREWIYIPDFYSEYRYILGSVGKKPLITIGINPSTAAPNNLDNTLQSVNRIAIQNGFDSFIMFNVYAQRATRPDDMDYEFNMDLHKENMKAFRWVLEQSGNNPTVWAAWGTIISKRKYLKNCLNDMLDLGSEFHAMWVRAGNLSKHGHPHHPLYLKKDSILEQFDVNNYLKKLY